MEAHSEANSHKADLVDLLDSAEAKVALAVIQDLVAKASADQEASAVALVASAEAKEALVVKVAASAAVVT